MHFLLARVFAGPIGVWLKGIGVEVAPDIATAAGIFAVSPGAPNLSALLNNDEIPVVISPNHVNGGTHSRKTSAYDEDGRVIGSCVGRHDE